MKVGVRSEPPLLVAILTSQRNGQPHRACGELSVELALVGSGERQKGKVAAFAPIGSRLAGPLTVLVASGRCWSVLVGFLAGYSATRPSSFFLFCGGDFLRLVLVELVGALPLPLRLWRRLLQSGSLFQHSQTP